MKMTRRIFLVAAVVAASAAASAAPDPEEVFPLDAFNALLEQFMRERLIGNPKYDFAKLTAGLEEFEVVTAGDSRPIAMSNLYFQDVGADICRQLAAHINSSTSFGYYMNVSNTIWASAVIRYTKRKRNLRRS